MNAREAAFVGGRGGAIGFDILQENDRLRREVSELERSEAALSLLLEERDALLKELRCRVKDDMTCLISLLALQAESVAGSEASDALLSARRRVQCMEVLYNKLDVREKKPCVPVREYFDEILPDMFQALTPPCPVSLLSEIDDVLIPADCVFPIGIIAGELISSAMKDAFPDRGSGAIEFGFRVESDRECVLSVTDDGIVRAAPAGGAASAAGFGAFLVDILSRQLHARVEVRRDPGTRYSIYLPVDSCPRAPAPSA